MTLLTQETMRPAIIASFVLAASTVFSEERTIDYSSLLKVPDLSPHLTSGEVSKEFTPWTVRVTKVAVGWKSDFAAMLTEARTELGSKLPQVTGITFYSLFPIDAPNLRKNDAKLADDLEKLSKFHDYPIFGEVRIDDVDQANRWVDFLRDQIIPGDFLACDFRPRHGFRLSTVSGTVDILMCYSCDQLSYFGSSELLRRHNPVFSPATEALLNQLFDKLKITRDEPPKTKG